MKILQHQSDLKAERRLRCLAMGVFDGVHRGHQEIIRRAVAGAADAKGEAWVLTFDTHPARILQPGSAPPLLNSLSQRLGLLERLGVAGCLLIHFTRPFADQEPESFLNALHQSAPGLRRIFVGRNWRFGKAERGDVALLTRWAEARGVGVEAVDPVQWGSQAISSTRIRSEIAKGNLQNAATMLGRPFSVIGEVVPGDAAGRQFGVPTANISPENEIQPPRGVYAVYARQGGQALLEGVANLGFRPTRDLREQPPLRLELHLLDFQGSLYGTTIEVFFVSRLRDERRFASTTELANQIRGDIESARQILADEDLKNEWKNALQGPERQI
jgi:riboflavin kinase/FMN adenylyltransferase